MAKICLLSSIHPWVNPRIVKEADALHAVGHEVIVGHRANANWALERDRRVLAGKPWKVHVLDYVRENRPRAWFAAALRQRIASELVRRGVKHPRADAEAYCRAYKPMREWAVAQDADLYIAHTQQMLPVAAHAASVRGVPYAFDCEDLLAEEVSDGLLAPEKREMILRLERRYLPGAAYVSATSVPMRDYLIKEYALHRVPVWHNCFPLREVASLAPPDRRPRGDRVRLVWMSATIGPNRGLEDVFAALPQLGGRFELHLYGNLLPAHEAWFEALARGLQDRSQLSVHPIPTGSKVMGEIARHEIGLTLDLNDCLNRSLTICNKLFLYLQAGLPTVATDTPGQAFVLADGELGRIYPPGDAAALVKVLRWMEEPGRLRNMQRAAWEAGQHTYNWDREQLLFLDEVNAALRGVSRDEPGEEDVSVAAVSGWPPGMESGIK